MRFYRYLIHHNYACKGVFNPKIFQYFRQIPRRVCTLVLFIIIILTDEYTVVYEHKLCKSARSRFSDVRRISLLRVYACSHAQATMQIPETAWRSLRYVLWVCVWRKGGCVRTYWANNTKVVSWDRRLFARAEKTRRKQKRETRLIT